MKIVDNPTVYLIKKRILELEAIGSSPEIEKLKLQFDKLSKLPDEYNKIFSDRCWIAYESLNIHFMEKALNIYKTKNIDQAEKYIVDYYNFNHVSNNLMKLWGIKKIRDRLPVLKSAAYDYLCGRYYSCIPILIMMIDGIIADVGNNQGFHTDTSQVDSWDSIAGHSSGLRKIREIYKKTRAKTTKEKIILPYRNGILHGKDLGYANLIVAAKCWAILFAVRDWAESITTQEERMRKNEIEKNKNIYDITLEMRELEASLFEAINSDRYKRKVQVPGIDFPENGHSDLYPINSPEKRLVEFFEMWQKNNYGFMSKLLHNPYDHSSHKIINEIKNVFSDKKVFDFCITSNEDITSCLTKIVTLNKISSKLDNPTEYELEFRIVYCKPDSNEFEVNPQNPGEWKLLNNFEKISQIGTPLELGDD